jgi:hypothetical protein
MPKIRIMEHVMGMIGRKALVLFTGLCLTFMSGCQTYVMEAGLTLPSPHYLRHAPQYFPPSPPYPLPRELKSIEEATLKVQDNQQ